MGEGEGVCEPEASITPSGEGTRSVLLDIVSGLGNKVQFMTSHGVHTKSRGAAFTLAEVLITLGIIGVVAAMTMPTLIKKHQQQVLVTRLQKNYSIVSQALVTSVSENGKLTEWDLGTDYNKANLKRVVDKYFVPYFKKLKMYENPNSNSCYETYGFYLADGTLVLFGLDGSSDKGLPPGAIGIIFDFKNTKLEAGNATANMDFSRSNFAMRIDSDKLMFFNWGKIGDNWSAAHVKSRDELINHSKYGCNANIPKNKRLNCGALIQWDGWKISDDYPW